MVVDGFVQVSGLFARDEMDEICQELIAVMKREFPRRPPTNENLNDFYLSRVRKNLHVVLCFSPVSLLNMIQGSVVYKQCCHIFTVKYRIDF